MDRKIRWTWTNKKEESSRNVSYLSDSCVDNQVILQQKHGSSDHTRPLSPYQHNYERLFYFDHCGHVLLHLKFCMVYHYWTTCCARKLAVVWALLGIIKTNSNRNVVDFKLVEMMTDSRVHVLKEGQASMHFVLPYEELKRAAAIGVKLRLQQNHILAINAWRPILWIVQFYHQAMEDP